MVFPTRFSVAPRVTAAARVMTWATKMRTNPKRTISERLLCVCEKTLAPW